jgi:uncharacterized protein YbjT (DUF2867 family)
MILVTGATGTVGSELLKRLSGLGVNVLALARKADKSAELPGVEFVTGDLSDKARLGQVMRLTSKVFLLAPAEERQPELEGNVIDAAKGAGVKHIVKLSALHADAHSKSRILRWHAAGEQHLRFSGVPWTVLRPNMFMQELLRQSESIRNQGAFYLPLKTVKISLIDARDVAEAAAEALTGKGHEGRTYELTGPEALSFDEVGRRVSAGLEREVRYVPTTMQEFADSAVESGAPKGLVEAVCELYSTFPGKNDGVKQGVRELLGRAPRRIEEFARDHAAQLTVVQ